MFWKRWVRSSILGHNNPKQIPDGLECLDRNNLRSGLEQLFGLGDVYSITAGSAVQRTSYHLIMRHPGLHCFGNASQVHPGGATIPHVKLWLQNVLQTHTQKKLEPELEW